MPDKWIIDQYHNYVPVCAQCTKVVCDRVGNKTIEGVMHTKIDCTEFEYVAVAPFSEEDIVSDFNKGDEIVYGDGERAIVLDVYMGGILHCHSMKGMSEFDLSVLDIERKTGRTFDTSDPAFHHPDYEPTCPRYASPLCDICTPDDKQAGCYKDIPEPTCTTVEETGVCAGGECDGCPDDMIQVQAVFGCGHESNITTTIDDAGPDVAMSLDELCPSCQREIDDKQIEEYEKFDPTSYDRPFDHCCQCYDYDDTCGIDPKCKRSINEYFVFIVRRRYAFGETGDVEATVLIPQDVDTSIVEEIEAFLSDKHSDMWAGPFMDEFRVTLDDDNRPLDESEIYAGAPDYEVNDDDTNIPF